MPFKKIKSRSTSGLFDELARKNVRKSAKDYFIYFFTLALSVCLFYSFNSISTQFTSLGIEDKLNYLAFSSGMLNGFSVIVCIIMGALVVYANRFLLKRRKKEMGIYATLGMERKELNGILMRETLRIGAFSLVAGLVMGIFAAQILSLLTAKLAGISLESYRFMVSFKSIGLSVLFFGILFIFVHFFNTKELKKMSLLDMLYSDRKNETVAAAGIGAGWLFAVLSIALTAGGYYILITVAEEDIARALGQGVVLLMLGTLFFIKSVLRISTRLEKMNKRYYFKNLNLFTTSQFSSRLKSESTSIAMTSVLLFLSLSLIILGPGMGKYVTNGIEYSTPYDASIYYSSVEGKDVEDPMELLKSAGFDLQKYSNSYEAFWTYTAPSLTSDFLSGEKAEYEKSETNHKVEISHEAGGFEGYDEAEYAAYEQQMSLLTILGLEDYNRILASQNQEPVQLKEGEYAVSYAFPVMEKKLEEFQRNPKTLTIGDTSLSLAPKGIYRAGWKNQNILSENGTIIVPQSKVRELTRDMWFVDLNYLSQDESFGDKVYDGWFNADVTGFQLWTRQETMVSLTADNLLTTYLGLYLGMTFLITAGAVLAIQQMAHSADNIKRYNLLKKLGASKRNMKQTVTKQLRVYFGMPLLLAVIHTSVIVGVVFSEFEGFDAKSKLTIIGAGGLIVFGVYIVYYITTYLGSKRILQLK